MVWKYRNGKVPLQIKPTDGTGPTFPELEPAIRVALETSRAELDALVLVETRAGSIEAVFIWGDPIVPHLARA